MTLDTGGIRFVQQPDPWARLPELAKRLGVEQCESAGIMITTAKGERYDFFELITAFLDKLEGKLK